LGVTVRCIESRSNYFSKLVLTPIRGVMLAMSDVRRLLDEIKHENEMWEAYLAGVNVGLDTVVEDVDTTSKETFRRELEERFEAFMGECHE